MTEPMNETTYEDFIAVSRYARWIEDEGRRETYPETVDRYINFMKDHLEKRVTPLEDNEINSIREAILNKEVMPSMRALMTSGPALARDHTAGYNCSYMPIESIECFDELMYILLCGCGVGFSVEAEAVSKLPVIEKFNGETSSNDIAVEDSKAGWATAFRELVTMLYKGVLPKGYDVSKVRPAGSRLKTFGGRASGPGPLVDLFNYTTETFLEAQGRKLTPYEVFDICCKTADVVVSGGVRRSALICLSDLDDQDMAHAKTGGWFNTKPHFALANISFVTERKPSIGRFMKEWLNIYESKSGERGIFNRKAAQDICKHLNVEGAHEIKYGTNPCSEIILKPYQFCNLSEVVIRPEDYTEDIKRKIRIATVLGTYQATLTDFEYLRPIWKKNCEEEALLGVSLTGIRDSRVFGGDIHWKDSRLYNLLFDLKDIARETNEKFSDRFKINRARAITCVKPSGTVSQLVNSSSGIHNRFAPYYIRNVRVDRLDPICEYLIDRGIPHETDLQNDKNIVFSFPQKAPNPDMTENTCGALDNLRLWLMYAQWWCEHKPSMTVYIEDHEWLEVGAWVYDNYDYISGLAFLPRSDHNYAQAPYIEITKDKYEEMLASADYSKDDQFVFNLMKYETEDHTQSSQTLACAGGICEVVDLVK